MGIDRSSITPAMVRFKSRYLLVRIETPGRQSFRDTEFPTKQELSRALRDHFVETNGIAASGTALDIQVRFCDPATRLCLIRVPRNEARRIRASFCFLSQLASKRVVISTISVHGSARTAKRVLIKEVADAYKAAILLKMPAISDSGSVDCRESKTQLHSMSRIMQETLATIQAIDY